MGMYVERDVKGSLRVCFRIPKCWRFAKGKVVMAFRSVLCCYLAVCMLRRRSVDFEYQFGFSVQQKQRSKLALA